MPKDDTVVQDDDDDIIIPALTPKQEKQGNEGKRERGTGRAEEARPKAAEEARQRPMAKRPGEPRTK